MIEYLFEPYKEYSNLDIGIEILAVLFSIISSLYSKKNNIKVYPTGIINTLLYIYLLYKWNLFGDLILNLYYLIMSCIGWYNWSSINNNVSELVVSKLNLQDYKFSGYLYVISTIFVSIVYLIFDKFGFWWSYIDILTTGLFFIGMYLLTKRKIEHWLFLLVANMISIPLYFFKGYTLTSLLFIIYSIISVLGYLEWRKIWKENTKTT